MEGRIELTFRWDNSYEKGSENHVSDLTVALAYFINGDENGRDLYDRWLFKGDTLITIEKGIHHTKDDRRPHFTLRVGSKAFHAYIFIEPLYTLVSKNGETLTMRKPIIFNVTESFPSSASKGRFSKKPLKKRTQSKGRTQAKGFRVLQHRSSKSSILSLMNIRD